MCEHLAGRLATVTFEFRCGKMFLSNIHNFGISAYQAQRLSKKIATYAEKANSDVGVRSVAILCGDFNFTAENDPPTRTSINENAPIHNDEPAHHKYVRKHWSEVTSAYTELHQPEHTRIGTPPNEHSKYFYTSRIDRIYVSWQPWQVMNMSTNTTTYTPSINPYTPAPLTFKRCL